MIRAQRVAGVKGLDLRVAAMPEGEDPADMLQADRLDRFHELVEGAIDLPSFRVRTALERGDLGSVAGRERTRQRAAAGGSPVTRAPAAMPRSANQPLRISSA